ncbi:hypothetical protein [Dyadobacter aurulentus]|uniref:hypothetical protein n=1 Tax=Dyadobacter sp. UC 10 TaxID=2605428 RepID=UPI0011F211C4|nr:hypothetical protein [Dyadobacter sp. UC 10]KAA0992901.1 hypothetical protein FXO21_23375 [Dyadobacter sp. UC 10]
MKVILFAFLALISVIGCDKYPPGPYGDVFMNNANGQWILKAYKVRGKGVSADQVPEKRRLNIERALVQADSNYGSSIFETGHTYYTFSFLDLDGNKKSSSFSIMYGTDYNRKKKQDNQWFRINEDTGFLVAVEYDAPRGVTTRIEVSNIMKGEKYNPDLDTLRYIYIPKFN